MVTRKRLPILLLILILTASLVSLNVNRAAGSSKTITVPTDYSSIQDAINNAVDGDTVYIKKGYYVENPIVNKTISLIGEDRDATVIDVTAGLKVLSDGAVISGLRDF